jgi:hypothetical protein
MSLLLVSCANTSITQSWVEKEQTKTYKHPMIIAISDSQQTRRIFEKLLVSGLSENNITATPSYTLISSKKKITRETVVNALQGTQIDSVLVTYLVSADEEMKYHDSPINMGYSGNVDNNMMSDTLVSIRGRPSSADIIVLKNDFYDAQSKTVIWSVQTKTVAPHSIDEVVTDVTELLIQQLLDDNVLYQQTR